MARRLRAPLRQAIMAAGLLVMVFSTRACQPQHNLDTPPATNWKITTVHDGDTVTAVTPDGRNERIRLLGIDAPEYRQEHGKAARAALARKVTGVPVRVTAHGRDQYNRLLGVLWIGSRNLNRELVAEGDAWVFDQSSAPADFIAAERAARQAHRGLWATPQPLRPAEWRRAHPRTP